MTETSDPRELFERGSSAATAGRHDEAVAFLRRAAELAPDISVIPFNLGNSLLALNQLEDRGWIERRPDASDGRSRRLFLTAHARRTFGRMSRQAAEELPALEK